MSERKVYREYESVKAYVRIRPLEDKDEKEEGSDKSLQVVEGNKIVANHGKEGFQYEKVFDAEATNKDIFTAIIEKSWQCITKGINLCVFTYGQTSSGKTYTMKGVEKDPGLVVQTLEGIFSKLGHQYKCCFEITMSYFEVYNEMIFDLLDNNGKDKHLEIREDQHRNPYVENLTEKPIESFDAAKMLFEVGETKRKYAITTMNHMSSRSHVIVQLKIKSRFFANNTKTYHSTLMMADLAGSENIAKSKTSGQVQREGSNINKSLLSLSNIIMKLKCKEGFPSYRESKLTRILQPVLKENTATVVICTVNPSKDHLLESLSTLRFGRCAGGIKVELKDRAEDKITPLKRDQSAEQLIYHEDYRNLQKELSTTKMTLEETTSQVEILKQCNDELKEKLLIYQQDIEVQNEQIKKFQSDIKILNGIIETQERSIKVSLDFEYQKIIKDLKDAHNATVEYQRNTINELLEKGNRTSQDKRLKKMYNEISQSLLEKEREISVSRNTIYKLQEDNRRLRRELEEVQEVNNFRARKMPLQTSPALTKSQYKYSSRKDERPDFSPRPILPLCPRFFKPVPVKVGESLLLDQRLDESFDNLRPAMTFKSCITKLARD